MRERIFTQLFLQKGSFVSGEALSDKLNITRSAVSKHISGLRSDGADILSVQHKGHQLITCPNRLRGPYTLPLVKNSALISDFFWYDSVDSTNDVLKQKGDELKEIAICACEDQPGGKGRRGREWQSYKHKGIYVSFLLKPEVVTSDAFKITILAAIAQVRAIKEQTGLSAKIKWPNDLLIGGKKISGTLTELSADFDGINHIVCGVGINVNQTKDDFNDELKLSATSLNIEKGSGIDRLQLFASFIDAFIDCYLIFKEKGITPFLEEYTKYSACMGQNVLIISDKETINGKVAGFDKNGMLLLESDGETKRIMAGEVSLRGENGYV
ncbi:MAG: biotin--[acetyl-CoA-carboxylase] ligase [Eubacteriales bacterium]